VASISGDVGHGGLERRKVEAAWLGELSWARAVDVEEERQGREERSTGLLRRRRMRSGL
jgi:hypothetical protein